MTQSFSVEFHPMSAGAHVWTAVLAEKTDSIGIRRAPGPTMVWQVAKIDPTTDPTAGAVLKAFASAAGVNAWRREHPDQAPDYAAKRAVAVIIATHAKIRIDD